MVGELIQPGVGAGGGVVGTVIGIETNDWKCPATGAVMAAPEGIEELPPLE